MYSTSAQNSLINAEVGENAGCIARVVGIGWVVRVEVGIG